MDTNKRLLSGTKGIIKSIEHFDEESIRRFNEEVDFSCITESMEQLNDKLADESERYEGINKIWSAEKLISYTESVLVGEADIDEGLPVVEKVFVNVISTYFVNKEIYPRESLITLEKCDILSQKFSKASDYIVNGTLLAERKAQIIEFLEEKSLEETEENK